MSAQKLGADCVVELQVLRLAKLWCDVESAAEAFELSDLFKFTIPAGE